MTDLVSASAAMMGGGEEDEDIEEDPEPMSVICYRLEYGSVASR